MTKIQLFVCLEVIYDIQREREREHGQVVLLLIVFDIHILVQTA